MCTLTLSDFDALDTLDADTVLVAGEILKSEARAERCRLARAPHTKGGLDDLRRVANAEDQRVKRLENLGENIGGRPGGRVIVH